MKTSKQRTKHIKYQTLLGMSRLRHDAEVFNSQLKRNEIENPENILSWQQTICGCGIEGCGFIRVNRKETNDNKNI